MRTKYDAKIVTVNPSLTFYFEESQSSLGDDGTWGSRSKFWLVQNVDLQSGKMLEKPMITVFTTKDTIAPEQIASIMKTKPATVRSYLRRGREKLKKMMEADA